MQWERVNAVLALAVLLTACGTSPPVRFVTLDATELAGVRRSVRAPVKVVAVDVPRVLDRREVVQESEANRITLSKRARWAAPLAEMIRTVLTQDLLARLCADCVILPDAPAPPETMSIVVDVLRFESDSAGVVVFTGSYSFFESGNDVPRWRRQIELSEPALSRDSTAQARAMSTLLGRVADRIAADLPG